MTQGGNKSKDLEQKRKFGERRKKFAHMSEQEVENRFWILLDGIVDPLVRLSYDYTSPSVERSVLLRMGFNSVEATEIVEGCEKRGLLGKGAGHVVLKLAKAKNIDIKTAGSELIEGRGFDEVMRIFGGEKLSVDVTNKLNR